ncbi:MAG: sulfotransferase family protein [Nitrospinales bacterium]
MIASDKHKLIYIYLPKVACSSIKKSIFPLFNIDGKTDPHDAGLHTKPTWDILTDKEYFTFAFVRNPWDRLVSFYRDKITGVYSTDGVNFYKQYYGAQFRHGMTFKELATLICTIPDCISELHFRSQYCSLVHNGKLLPNFLGRYENLQEDFDTICETTGLSLKLPHMFNDTPKDELKTPWEKTDYRTFYTKDLAELVGKRFSKDIDYFGYKFDG